MGRAINQHYCVEATYLHPFETVRNGLFFSTSRLETRMEFAIVYLAGPDVWKDLVIAEDSGFTHAWFYDSQMLYSDVFVCLALAAEHTKRIKLGPGVAIPSNRIEPVTAHSIATINLLVAVRTRPTLDPSQLEPLLVANPSVSCCTRDAVCALLAARRAQSVSTIGPDKLYALDKRCGRAALSRFGGINAKADPCDTRCPIFVKISFERSVEVDFGDDRLIGFGFPKANEAATRMEIATDIWKIDLLVGKEFVRH
jgi:hypothetical protein